MNFVRNGTILQGILDRSLVLDLFPDAVHGNSKLGASSTVSDDNPVGAHDAGVDHGV